jgi:hypothetical protein
MVKWRYDAITRFEGRENREGGTGGTGGHPYRVPVKGTWESHLHISHFLPTLPTSGPRVLPRLPGPLRSDFTASL